MRICTKCGESKVTTNAGIATCTDCQPRKNPKYRLRPHRRTVVQRGQEHGRAMLTEEKAREILARCQRGESAVLLAAEYGVTASTIGHIKMGRTWQHLHAAESTSNL